MKHPVKTLAALAILGVVAPSAHAVSIKDDVMSITPTVRIQTRAQISDATAGGDAGVNEGEEYRINGGVADAANDPIDFSLRRARLGLNFKYGANWKGQFTVMADNVDRANYNAGRGLEIRYGWVERGFDLGDGMAAAVKFGLDKPEQNATDRLSSGRRLMPNDNASSGYLNPRGVGIAGRFQHPLFMVGVDLQNNMSAAAKNNTETNNDESEGFYYGIRAEFSFSPDWFIAKRSESFVGKEGHGLNLGLSYGVSDGMLVSDTNIVTGGNQEGALSQSAYGVDVMLWLNGLSAWAEYRVGKNDLKANGPGETPGPDVDLEFITIQLAYAFPVGDEVLEPAIRYQIIDNNTDADEAVSYGNNAESGASGSQIDIALNYYLSGHDNKLSLAVSLWESEEGEGDATIIRLQHQINF